MISTKPYISHALNEAFASGLVRTVPSDIPAAINSITVVGGLFDKHHALFGDDIKTITRSLIVLDRAGIAIAEKPEFRFYNLLAPLKNDFLEAAFDLEEGAPQSDLLIVSAVCATRSENCVIGMMHPTQQDEAYEDFYGIYQDWQKGFHQNRELSISAYQRYSDAWATGAHNAGVKIIVTRGNQGDEICTDHFLRGDFYQAAIESSEDYEMVYGSVSAPLGVCIHNDALPDLQKIAVRHDRLGERILAL